MELVEVSFNIQSRYRRKIGLYEEEQEQFDKDIREIFTGLGFEYVKSKRRNVCDSVVRGEESLYCHPIELTGTLKESSIEEVEKALRKAKSFKYIKENKVYV